MVLILQLALISPSAFKNDHKVSQIRETSMFLASKGSLYVFYSFLWPLSPRTRPFVFPLSPATVKQTASHLHTNNAALVMPMDASSMSSGYWFGDSSCVTKLLMPRPSHPRIQCHVWKRLHSLSSYSMLLLCLPTGPKDVMMPSLDKYVPETFTPVLLPLKHEPGQMTPCHSHLINVCWPGRQKPKTLAGTWQAFSSSSQPLATVGRDECWSS